MILLTNLNLNKNELQNAVMQPLGTAPGNAVEGQIYYNSTTKTLEQYTGTAWRVVGNVIARSTNNGSISINGIDVTVYELPTASPDVLGGIKTGAGIQISEDGVAAIEGLPDVLEEGDYEGKQFRLDKQGNLEWYKPEDLAVIIHGTEDNKGLVERVDDLSADKVDKVDGKQLSTEDYSTTEKEKLGTVADGAQVNVLEGIKVNGRDIAPTEKVVDISVPVNTSDLINDEEFIDKTVNNLTNYYLKSQTYSKEEIAELFDQFSTLNIQKVETLPTGADISLSTIYLLPLSRTEDNNIYEEYIYVSSTSTWEKIGTTSLDLSNYLQKTDDASNVIVKFVSAGTRELPASDEALATIMGKIVKYLGDMHSVAFSGNFDDIANKPTNVVYAVNATLAANSLTQTVTIPEGSIFVDASTIDSTTGEIVFTDVTRSGTEITITISEAYTNPLDIIVSYRM